jgi:SAM-dependent methyltransferase
VSNGANTYDAELRRHNEVLRLACAIQARDHVLDIGCGTGLTTRQAARAAREGSALGVDVSAAAVERARQLASEEQLVNVAFEQADAQAYRFPQERFDVAISRFGTMFFGDPAAAFANIGRALRPAGRLVMMVWQAHERNEWDVTLREALAISPAPGDTDGQDAFSLGDPRTVTELLEAGGFTDVGLTDVNEPVYYGEDVDVALDWVRRFTCTSQALARLNPDAAESRIRRLREALAAHKRDDGVWFNSSAWIVAARRV